MVYSHPRGEHKPLYKISWHMQHLIQLFFSENASENQHPSDWRQPRGSRWEALFSQPLIGPKEGSISITQYKANLEVQRFSNLHNACQTPKSDWLANCMLASSSPLKPNLKITILLKKKERKKRVFIPKAPQPLSKELLKDWCPNCPSSNVYKPPAIGLDNMTSFLPFLATKSLSSLSILFTTDDGHLKRT